MRATRSMAGSRDSRPLSGPDEYLSARLDHQRCAVAADARSYDRDKSRTRRKGTDTGGQQVGSEIRAHGRRIVHQADDATVRHHRRWRQTSPT